MIRVGKIVRDGKGGNVDTVYTVDGAPDTVFSRFLAGVPTGECTANLFRCGDGRDLCLKVVYKNDETETRLIFTLPRADRKDELQWVAAILTIIDGVDVSGLDWRKNRGSNTPN